MPVNIDVTFLKRWTEIETLAERRGNDRRERDWFLHPCFQTPQSCSQRYRDRQNQDFNIMPLSRGDSGAVLVAKGTVGTLGQSWAAMITSVLFRSCLPNSIERQTLGKRGEGDPVRTSPAQSSS
ncbi:uncharacterized protein UDID_17219 [Ustilago sp. UG-2017a]|nr:uncharacterized protein UDID_17219 [Ustilago sp. UG-2017a]